MENWIYTRQLHNVGAAVVIVGKVNVTTGAVGTVVLSLLTCCPS